MKILKTLLIICFFCAVANAQKTNFLLINLDDDSFVGQDFSDYMPSIKGLEAKALTLSNFYSPSISESAIELLTGKYPVNVKNALADGDMLSEEACIAKDLQALGYSSAYIGRWRAVKTEEGYPSSLGFNLFYGVADNTYKWPSDWQLKSSKSPKFEIGNMKAPELSLIYNGDIIEIAFDYRNFIEDATREAISFMNSSMAKNKPFFVYLNYASSYSYEYALKMFFPDTTKENIATHYSTIDKGVARIIMDLERKGLLEDTMIIFMSKSATKLSALTEESSKNFATEGKYKKSAFVYMPKLFKEPKELDGVVCTIDIPAFILDVAKGSSGENSMLGYFLGTRPCDDSPILYFGLYKDAMAMRDGNFKIVLDKVYRGIALQLYDLSKDPLEENNLAKLMPEKALELRKKARALDAQQPKIYTKAELAKIKKQESDAKAKKEKEAKQKEKLLKDKGNNKLKEQKKDV